MMRLSVKDGVTACIANSVDLDQAWQNLDPDLHMRKCPDKRPCWNLSHMHNCPW